MTERRIWTGGERPPPFRRPPPDTTVGPGTLLGLWLDSIPVAARPFTTEEALEFSSPPPLSADEAERIAAYLSERWGPAADAERNRTS